MQCNMSCFSGKKDDTKLEDDDLLVLLKSSDEEYHLESTYTRFRGSNITLLDVLDCAESELNTICTEAGLAPFERSKFVQLIRSKCSDGRMSNPKRARKITEQMKVETKLPPAIPRRGSLQRFTAGENIELLPNGTPAFSPQTSLTYLLSADQMLVMNTFYDKYATVSNQVETARQSLQSADQNADALKKKIDEQFRSFIQLLESGKQRLYTEIETLTAEIKLRSTKDLNGALGIRNEMSQFRKDLTSITDDEVTDAASKQNKLDPFFDSASTRLEKWAKIQSPSSVRATSSSSSSLRSIGGDKTAKRLKWEFENSQISHALRNVGSVKITTDEEEQKIERKATLTNPTKVVIKVEHVHHASFDSSTGKYMGLPDDWMELANQQFGVNPKHLEGLLVEPYQNKIPRVLIVLKTILFEGNGHLLEGIFRKGVSSEVIKATKKQINAGKLMELDYKTIDMHLVANLVKNWFRDLPNPILQSIRPAVIEHTQTQEQFAEFIEQVPQPNRDIMLWLLDLCAEVSFYEDTNRMGTKNLSVVISPNLYDPSQIQNMMRAMTISQKLTGLVQAGIDWRCTLFQE